MKITCNRLAEITGFDRRTIKARISVLKPIGIKGTAIYYESSEALELLYEPPVINNKTLDLKTEQARLAKEQADGHELENNEMRRKLITANQVAGAWGSIVNAIKNEFLPVPGKLAKMLKASKTTKERRTIIDREIRARLETLADNKDT